MTFDLSVNALLLAFVIFALRVFNNALGTIRIVLITRERRMWAAVFAFLEALTFAVVIANVVKDLSNVLNMLAYCGGFSVGGYVGMAIEARFITSYVVATITTQKRGHEIAQALRERGYGVTETLGIGRDGEVEMLQSVISRRDANDVMQIVHDIRGEAFISISEVRAIQHGWLRRGNQPR